MIIDIEKMEVKQEKVDYIMHFTNPLWLFCRLYKIVGKDCAKWILFGRYERVWFSIFRKES